MQWRCNARTCKGPKKDTLSTGPKKRGAILNRRTLHLMIYQEKGKV